MEKTSMVDSLAREVTVLEGPVGPELYCLLSDPWCTQDVLASHRDVARQMQAGLVAFLRGAGMREDHLPYFAATLPEMRD